MTCYKPRKAWAPMNPDINTGRYVFDATKALNVDNPKSLPCGGCIGCRQEKVTSWMVRCLHESKVHEASCFITLTFADEHLPTSGSVSIRDVQLFMRKLRKRFGKGIRFFACGEYGSADKTFRPHYHILLFGFDFPDKVYFCRRNGFPVFTSAILSELWPQGRHEIGSVTGQSAGYCAQYAQKKITGKMADDHYWRPSPVTGEMVRLNPEFATMSRMPGLGSEWLRRFHNDVFPSYGAVRDGQQQSFLQESFILVDGRKVTVPRFYIRTLSDTDGERVKRMRRRVGKRYSFEFQGPDFRSRDDAQRDRTPERLAVREFIKSDRLKRLVRSL